MANEDHSTEISALIANANKSFPKKRRITEEFAVGVEGDEIEDVEMEHEVVNSKSSDKKEKEKEKEKEKKEKKCMNLDFAFPFFIPPHTLLQFGLLEERRKKTQKRSHHQKKQRGISFTMTFHIFPNTGPWVIFSMAPLKENMFVIVKSISLHFYLSEFTCKTTNRVTLPIENKNNNEKITMMGKEHIFLILRVVEGKSRLIRMY